jgi:uncharacterized membrane protein YfcA
MKATIRTWQAFLIVLALIFIGFIWTTFYPNSPYTTFSTAVGLIFGGYAGKRLAQKTERFNSEIGGQTVDK